MNKYLEAIRPEGLIEARHNLTAKENNIIDLVLNTIKDDKEYVYEIDIDKYNGIYNLGSANVYGCFRLTPRKGMLGKKLKLNLDMEVQYIGLSVLF